MKKKILHLKYYLENLNENTYCRRLYFSKSNLIEFFSYKHLYYALNLANFENCNVILDLGCGDGPFLPTLNQSKKKIIGVDNSKYMLSHAKTLIRYDSYPLKKVSLVNADGMNLPFREKCIDLIFCLEIFEHFHNSKKAIDDIHRILKENGELVYSVPIEIGFSLILRYAIAKLIRFKIDDIYSVKELFINGILKRPPKKRYHLYNNRKLHYTHKNFDWRVLRMLIIQKFKHLETKYSPLSFLKSINLTVINRVLKI